MCGICGIAHADPSQGIDVGTVVRMRDSMSYRGPDGDGIHVEAGVALAHRRLSIIDVTGGAQPLSNEDGTIWVTYNGEIYNFQELRERLDRLGHCFRTHSDTEVLVHAYEAWGDDFVTQLNGMFAFAIHDVKRGRVLLARDHLGIKPLFYRLDRGTLYFASEIKGIIAGGVRAQLRPESLQEYMVFRYMAGGNTFFDGVQRLPSGHIAVFERGRVSTRYFWTPPLDESAFLSLPEAADALDGLLRRSVESQLMSEVPLGTFCSGGVDSGLVSTFAASASPHALQTFAVGFEDEKWDERALAADTARRIGSDHHTVMAEAGEFLGLLPRLIWHHDEPLSHPNSIPLYQLSRFARQFVTVVLTGEGSDELFCGYPRYHIARWRGAIEPLPSAIRSVLAGVVGVAPGHRAAKLAHSLNEGLDDAILLNSAYVAPDLVARLTRNPVEAALAERRALLARTKSDAGVVATLSRYELLTYVGSALDRNDRMTMAASLEGRVPFLDVPLVEWGLRLPGRLKLAGQSNKVVVKKVADRYLSPAITHGAKSGFGIPLDAWFRSPVFSPLLTRLQDPSHAAAAFFDQSVLQRIVREHVAETANHGDALWLLGNVYLWAEHHVGAA
ncbi:MAG TPA: asparagine synthase (glutamine-hydrolyzing) [Gemmatimonadaceae bacterium]